MFFIVTRPGRQLLRLDMRHVYAIIFFPFSFSLFSGFADLTPRRKNQIEKLIALNVKRGLLSSTQSEEAHKERERLAKFYERSVAKRRAKRQEYTKREYGYGLPLEELTEEQRQNRKRHDEKRRETRVEKAQLKKMSKEKLSEELLDIDDESDVEDKPPN